MSSIRRESEMLRYQQQTVPPHLLEAERDIEAKVSWPTFQVCMGTIVFAKEKRKAALMLEKVSAAFRALGGDKATLIPHSAEPLKALKDFWERRPRQVFFMNAEELRQLIHLSMHPALSRFLWYSPFALSRLSRSAGAADGNTILVGYELSEGREVRLPPSCFRCHAAIIGATGTGKSTMLTHIISQLATLGTQQRERVTTAVDPHNWVSLAENLEKPEEAFTIVVVDCEGSLAHHLLRLRTDWKIAYYDPQEAPYSLNPFCLTRYRDDDEREVQRSALVGTTVDVIGRACGLSQSRSPRILALIHMSLNAALSTKDQVTWNLVRELLGALEDKAKLASLVRRHNILRDEARILLEYQKVWPKISESAFGALYRIDDFLSSRIMRRTFSTALSTVDVDTLLEPGNVSVFRFSRLNTPMNTLPIAATTIILAVWLACLRRMSVLPEEKRWPVLLVVDEFQIVADLPIIEATVAEMRKAGLFLFVVCQNLEQLPEGLQAALLTNIDTLAAFRVNESTARRIAVRFDPDLQPELIRDLVTAPAHHALVQIRIEDVYPPPNIIRSAPPPQETCAQEDLIEALATQRRERLAKLEAAAREMEPAWQRTISFPEPPPPRIYRILLAIVELEGHARAATLNSLSEVGFSYIPRNKESLAQILDLASSQAYVSASALKGHTVYRLTEKARNLLFVYAGESSAKAGLDEHRRIRLEYQWQYARQGYFVVPYSERSPEAVPDAIIIPPNSSGDDWDFNEAFALEVETHPGKHVDRVLSHCHNDLNILGLSHVTYVAVNDEGKQAILQAIASLPVNVQFRVHVDFTSSR
jgi:hypothetical protein